MRNLFLLLICFLVNVVVSYGQQKINGFGKLKLGMLLKEIPELCDPVRITNTHDYYSKVYSNTFSTPAYELIADTSDLSVMSESLDKNVRSFQIGSYQITDAVNLENISLYFLNEKLYKIIVRKEQYGVYTSTSNLDDLLTQKYGKPKLTETKEPHTYINGFGNKIIKIDQTFTGTYKTNIPNVSCVSYLGIWYNDKGEKNTLSETTLANDSISKEVEKEISFIKGKIEKREEENKKKVLKDF